MVGNRKYHVDQRKLVSNRKKPIALQSYIVPTLLRISPGPQALSPSVK